MGRYICGKKGIRHGNGKVHAEVLPLHHPVFTHCLYTTLRFLMNILVDLTKLPKHRLKELAFAYHYGSWRSEEEARNSISGKAAAELAKRGGYDIPRPHLMKGSSE